MKKVLLIFTLFMFYCCKQEQIAPFKLIITDYDYAMAYSRQFVLTEKDLNVIFKAGLVEEEDSVIFSTAIQPTKDLSEISTIDFSSLEKEYENLCIDDGSQILVNYSKGNKTKNIRLSNYYQKDIGFVILFINKIVPEKHKIHYDKDELLEQQKSCDE